MRQHFLLLTQMPLTAGFSHGAPVPVNPNGLTLLHLQASMTRQHSTPNISKQHVPATWPPSATASFA